MKTAPAPFFGSFRAIVLFDAEASVAALADDHVVGADVGQVAVEAVLDRDGDRNLPSGARGAVTIVGVAFLLTGIGQLTPPPEPVALTVHVTDTDVRRACRRASLTRTTSTGGRGRRAVSRDGRSRNRRRHRWHAAARPRLISATPGRVISGHRKTEVLEVRIVAGQGVALEHAEDRSRRVIARRPTGDTFTVDCPGTPVAVTVSSHSPAIVSSVRASTMGPEQVSARPCDCRPKAPAALGTHRLTSDALHDVAALGRVGCNQPACRAFGLHVATGVDAAARRPCSRGPSDVVTEDAGFGVPLRSRIDRCTNEAYDDRVEPVDRADLLLSSADALGGALFSALPASEDHARRRSEWRRYRLRGPGPWRRRSCGQSRVHGLMTCPFSFVAWAVRPFELTAALAARMSAFAIVYPI